ncbi:MAG: hypothetical protein IJB11_06755, partial [Oscillospiraceae bacterium]|nr:hypothetical protein [Oscillospiraceae bacterium]
VQRYLITDTSADLADPEDIEYTVCFYRTYNGIDIISDQEDGIVVSFNKYGLTELQYHWRDLQIVRTQHSKTGVITREQAQRIGRASLYATNSAALSSTDEPASNTWLAYVQVDDEVKCVWVCSTNGGYGNSILIDAITGEQIYM